MLLQQSRVTCEGKEGGGQGHVPVSIGREGNGGVVSLSSSFTVRPPLFREMLMGIVK